ncbi:hypothetical protein AVEN_84681-1, partial [Araneus ventricosus]
MHRRRIRGLTPQFDQRPPLAYKEELATSIPAELQNGTPRSPPCLLFDVDLHKN